MSRYVKAPGAPLKRRAKRGRKPALPVALPVAMPRLRYHREELADMRFDEREEIRAVLDRWRFD